MDWFFVRIGIDECEASCIKLVYLLEYMYPLPIIIIYTLSCLGIHGKPDLRV